MSDSAKTRITRVRTIGIPVTDLDRALTFYTDALGFDVVLDATFSQGQRWVEVAPPGADTSIALMTSPDATSGVDTGIRFATEDVAADHALLRSRGVDADADIMRWPGVPPMFTLRDPDGNRLVVVELS